MIILITLRKETNTVSYNLERCCCYDTKKSNDLFCHYIDHYRLEHDYSHDIIKINKLVHLFMIPY